MDLCWYWLVRRVVGSGSERGRGRGVTLRRSSSGLVLNPINDGGGVKVRDEENDTLALPLTLVSRTRVTILYVFLFSSLLPSFFFPSTFLLSLHLPYSITTNN